MKDISEQSVRAHYGELIGVGADWEVTQVAVDHQGREINAWAEWQTGRRLRCPECGKKSAGYDLQEERTWRHLDACGYTTLLHARVPRGRCAQHGVRSQRVPWAEPGGRYTLAFEGYAIEVLQSARSVSSACALLRVDWETGHRIRRRAVERGLARRTLEAVAYLGVDEKSFGRGQSYGTIVSDLERKRVLAVEEGRETASAQAAYESLGAATLGGVKAVAMDMWGPYVKATEELLPQAAVVHDKFHLSAILGKAVDQVRRGEHRELQRAGDERLTGSKYLWLMDPSKFTPAQEEDFLALLDEKLKAGRAWALKEALVEFWKCEEAGAAALFFARWHGRVKRSRLEPMKAAADTLKRHLKNILTYFQHRITNAAAEGLNSMIQSIKANARGFRAFANYRTAILFYLGKLDLFPCATHTNP